MFPTKSRAWMLAFSLSCLGSFTPLVHAVTTLTVATVNNRQMVEMRKLAPAFETANPDIRLNWVTMEEATLRQRVSADVSQGTGAFDVVTIGMYETPIWAKKGWLREITPSDAYNVKDLIPTVRDGLSYNKKLYAAPFYGEGSMTLFRTDLLSKAGLSIVGRPTWEQIREAAAKIHNPSAGVYGICLRGRAGWGDNMALLSTMVNTFGGQWFDMGWTPTINTPAWQTAVAFYVDLLTRYGPPGAADNSFNENLTLFSQGKCGIWVDATSAGTALVDPKFSRVAEQTGFAMAPVAVTTRGAGWLWAWALAIPTSSQNQDAGQRFVQWATSQEYLSLVAKTSGWAAMPSGTRLSTYRHGEFVKQARFAMTEAIAMVTADPTHPTLQPVPYVGVQFVGIPEFQEVGNLTGEEIHQALLGKQTVAQALARAQTQTERIMRDAGYAKK